MISYNAGALQELVTLLTRDLHSTGILIAAAAVFLFVFWTIVRLFRRTGSGGQFTVTFQSGVPTPGSGDQGIDCTQVPEPQTFGQPWDDRKEQLLHNLDVVERGVGRFYVVLLAVLMAAATGVIVFIYSKTPDDGSRQFLLLYGGVAYVLAMLWMTSQLFSALRRISPPPDMLSSLRSKINVTFQTSSSSTHTVDNDALDRAQLHLDSGGSLDEACAMIDPGYASMNTATRFVFRQSIAAVLKYRRSKG